MDTADASSDPLTFAVAKLPVLLTMAASAGAAEPGSSAEIDHPLPTLDELGVNLLIIGLLVAANGFFVAAEFAMVKVRASRIDALAAEGRRGAKSAAYVLDHLDPYLSACQLGITLASLALGWAGEPFVAALIVPLAERAGLEGLVGNTASHILSAGLAFFVITFLHIVIGEQAPKSLGIRRAESVLLRSAWVLRVFEFALSPLVRLLNGASAATLRLVGISPADGHYDVHNQDDLRVILSTSAKHGHLGRQGRRLMEKILDFPSKIVRQIMVPRTAMVVLRVENNLETNLRVAAESGHSRFPVVRGEREDVLGFVLIKDLYAASARGDADLSRVVRPALFLSENARLEKLLPEFQKRRVHLAIILDEYGATAGLVTLEDVLEEIVGEIQDEGDAEAPPVRRVADGVYLVDGLLPLAEFAARLKIDVSEFDGQADTVAGLMLALTGVEPRAGQEALYQGHRLRVEAVENRRIARLRFSRRGSSDIGGGPAPTGPSGTAASGAPDASLAQTTSSDSPSSDSPSGEPKSSEPKSSESPSGEPKSSEPSATVLLPTGPAKAAS